MTRIPKRLRVTTHHQWDKGEFIASIPQMSDEKIAELLRRSELFKGPDRRDLPKHLAEQEKALLLEFKRRQEEHRPRAYEPRPV